MRRICHEKAAAAAALTLSPRYNMLVSISLWPCHRAKNLENKEMGFL
jgi:hypothetical protein